MDNLPARILRTCAKELSINRKRKDTVSSTEFKKIMSVLLTRGKLLIDSMNILLTSELTLQRK